MRAIWVLLVAGVGLAAGSLAGCHERGAASELPPPRDRNAAAGKQPGMADLDRPFDVLTWMQGNDSHEPLVLAQHLARAAGGTWIVLAPRPLDEVKWQPNPRQQGSFSVSEALDAIRKRGASLSWEVRNGYVLLYFGPEEELARLRAQPPSEIVGAYLGGESGAPLVQAVADLWKLKLHAETDLFKTRDALLTARKHQKEDQEATGARSMLYGSMRRWGGASGGEAAQPSPLLELKVVERLEPAELLQRVAAYFGGECRHAAGDRWEMARLTDSRKLAAEIDRLKRVIETDSGSAGEGFSSYASRQGIGLGVVRTEEGVTVIPPPSEEVRSAFDSLAVLGAPAVPALAELLDPERAMLAQASMRVLGEMQIPEAVRALIAFSGTLRGPLSKKAQATRALLETELVRVLSRSISSETASWLADAARDDKLAPNARAQARLALASSGKLALLRAGPEAKELRPGEGEFVLSGLPEAPAGADAAAPLWTTTSPDGDTWAVFLSGRYGTPLDFWLARGRGGKWQEFLFTGQAFPRAQEYGQSVLPRKGSCVLVVKGDQVVIRAPDASLQTEQKRLEKALQNPKLDPKVRSKWMQRYYEIQQRQAAYMQGKRVFSLAALRKDTDQDGLTDVAEKRLGLDPTRADTDGDGVPDGKDANPLAKPSRTLSDRTQLLQGVFTALYGGDPSRDLILVMVEPEYWQEFYGARGRVLCISKEDYLRRSAHLGALRMLQFGGPTSADATILQMDGPCLFNEEHTKAELHFWQWSYRPAEPTVWMAQMAQSGAPVDRVARFERHGLWNVVSINPWSYETADRAAAELMQRSARDSGVVY
jgi:hypothetical protein